MCDVVGMYIEKLNLSYIIKTAVKYLAFQAVNGENEKNHKQQLFNFMLFFCLISLCA